MTAHRPFGSSDFSRRILVVDDDPIARLIARSALETEGYEFEDAATGTEALEAWTRSRPDLVLLDIMMPQMNGFEVCAEMHRRGGAETPPVLMVTGLEDEDAVSRAFAVGARDLINKPLHAAVLCQRVRRLVDASDAERKVEQLAYHDTLTGLANRTLFTDRLGNAVARARRNGTRIGLMILDLDNFNVVNDTLGHAAGDRLVQQLSERIVTCARDSDTVARLGGDEFAFVLEAPAAPVDVASVANRVLEAVRRAVQLEGREVITTGSLGLSMFPDDATDVAGLVRFADTALQGAKADGGDCSRFYTAQMSVTAMRRLLLESNLRQALERDQLRIHYQPQYELSSGQVIGVEALIRWQHPELGVVPPADFIPIAEETGMIVPIGEWVLRTVCQQGAVWHAAGAPCLRLAVNLSGRQLRSSNFPSVVESILRETGVPPHLLELEITESSLVASSGPVIDNLYILRDMGVQLAVDDFGTEYSSLRYLKDFPVHALKIDRGFMSGVPDDSADVAIVEAVLALAAGLGLRAVAEGVENDSQYNFLVERGCREAQGFLMARPAPADAVSLATAPRSERVRSELAEVATT